MINFFLSLLLFVLFFENLVVSIKYRNIHYIHMPNNAHNKNFNEKENREIYHNVNISGGNTIYEEPKNKYITLFLSNGKKILHSIFRNNNNNNITICNENTGKNSNINLKNNSENNTKNNSKNYSRGSSSCLNIQNVSNTYYDKRRIKKDIMNKKVEENLIHDENENNIINDKICCDEKQDLDKEIHVDEQNEKKSNSTLNNESFISILSNDNSEKKKDMEESNNYSNNFYLNSLEENIIYPTQHVDCDFNGKWKSHVDDILENDSYYSNMNDNSNKSCISDYELLKTSILLNNTKDDFPLYENSRKNILTTSGKINKNKNLKERKKKNLNRLFYTLKLTNNFSFKNSKNRRKYTNSYNSGSSTHSRYVMDNKEYIIYHNNNNNNNNNYNSYSNNCNNMYIQGNKKKYNRLYCKKSANSQEKDYDKDINLIASDKINSELSQDDLKYNSQIINMPNDHFNIITSDEKENIKKNAYKNYVNYINERRYGYFDLLEKKNEKIIRKLLIANNGMAALKCILSLKDWLFKKFYDENLIKIIVMATDEDIKSNAKYISLADKVIKVPGGKNIHNYANVPLIVELAKSENVDAVWPGWGHSSENPLLSTLLEKENIIFIGPTGNVMEALGDKISANILAQSVEVPVVKWSGDNIRIDKFENNKINDELYNNATIHSLDDCIKECKRIGFPVMIKASQGGGGKGIRKVENEYEIKKAYEQVQNELPNSPIFLMKVCNNVRHIEIQVVGDMYGNVCSLSGRDCTTQRRFQKIFEEGPPSVVPYPIFREMEKSSIRLTKMIKYRGAGTIEYLYDQINKKYFFLELNPRLQVEHPVSEGITNCNLISIQLQVAMGIPLQNIDDIRNLYQIDKIEKIKKKDEQKKEFELTDNLNQNLCNNNSIKSLLNYDTNENVNRKYNLLNEHFDFYNNKPYIKNHVIAARITAENSNDSFKPTSGNVRRINFQNWKDVWGYFSINDGFVHEFSDSQIGHIFAKGETREVARKNLILALRKLHIDGDIKTGTKYLAKILESKAFIDNNITTNWLDIIIEKKKHVFYNTCHIILLCATIFKLLIYFMNEKGKVEENLDRDDIAIKRDKNYGNVINKNNNHSGNINNNGEHMCKMKSAYIFDMIFQNIKYPFKGYNIGENLYQLEINGQEIEISAEYDKNNNKVFSTFNNQTYIYACSEDTLGIYMQLEKDNIFIPNVRNPYHLISNTNGKIVKYLINDGEEVKKNDDYIEVEAMKMIMTFKSTESGILRHKLSEGTIIKIGDLLGIIEKKDNDKKHIKQDNEIQYFNGHLDLSNKYTYELIDNRTIFPNILDDNYNKSSETLSEEGLKDEMYHGQMCDDRMCDDQMCDDQMCDDENVVKKNDKEQNKSHKNLKENNMDECTYEDDNYIYMKENQKKKLFMKQNRKKIFRLFSNDNEKITTALNYLNDKFHCVKNYLSNLNFSSANSVSDSSNSSYQNNKNNNNNNDNNNNNYNNNNNNNSKNKKKNNSVQYNYSNAKYSNVNMIHKYDKKPFDKSYLMNEVNSNNVNVLMMKNKNNSTFPLIENLENNISTEIMSSRNTSNEKILHNNISKDNTISEPIFNNNSSDESNINNITFFNNLSNNGSIRKRNNNNNSSSSNNNNNNNNNNKNNNFKHSYYMDYNNDNIYWNHVKNEKSKYLLDIPIMKRIEFLLKGYEQDYEKCFDELINKKDIKNVSNWSAYIINNINDILDTFIQYNILFSKKEFISEIDLYDILYNNIRDKKKQYEIIHAYTYNDLSIKFIEKILKYILNNINSNLAFDIILDKLKILAEFKGKIFRNIIVLSRHILFLLEGLELIEYIKIALNYNDNKNMKNGGKLSNNMLLLSNYMKKNNLDFSKMIEYKNNKNDIEIVNMFFKGHSSNIHMFVPSLIKSNKNSMFLKFYLNNLYKYCNIKSIMVTNNIIKFSINNSEYTNLLIWNENDTIDINKILESDIKINNDRYLNTVHIINTNNELCLHPSHSFEENIIKNKILQKCKKLYIYNYANNKYGDIYEWKNEDLSKGLVGKYSKDGSINNILPYEEYIFGNEKEILEYYELKNINQAIYEKTKIFFGIYKNNKNDNNIRNNVNNNYTSLFGHRVIDFNDIKNTTNEYNNFEEHNYQDDKFIFNKDIHNILLELKESLNDISRGRLNTLIRDNKISSCIIYHIIVDDMMDIETIKEAYKVFMIKYNEMILENYVNNIFIKIYRTNKKSCTENAPQIQLERMFKLNVLLNKGEINQFPSFQIDTLYMKRKRAREVDTLYAYDFINLINISLNRSNKNRESHKICNYINSIKEFKLKSDMICYNSNSDNLKNHAMNIKSAHIPLEKKEEYLFEHFDNLSNYEIKIRKSLYLSDKLDIGQNKRSVVGLLLNIRTDEYEEGRDVIFIINDISTQGGSFSIFEDELFYGISSYAREKKIPRIYISCNSGARIGLYNFLMDKIRIEWKDEQKKELGYKYIYITQDVKEQIDKEDIIFLTEIIENNEKRYIIDAIVGNLKNPVGVENLRGSGLIAGETSKAYEEIFTLSYVTGRSVGIGAYLVRLGKRTIQKKGSSLLLTGFNALNKILGENVYVSNEQLGGVNIMMRNGISQVQVESDQEGMDKIIQWLSYVPRTSNDYYDLIQNIYKENNRKFLQNNNFLITNKQKTMNTYNNLFIHNNKNTSKPNDNSMSSYNFELLHINDMDYDHIDDSNIIDLIKGTQEEQGFLDKNTYFEYMNEWGKGIITGRGKLGSIPVGFIAVNKNLVTQSIPCDPALKTKAQKLIQAPCVFFPDNSFKTAQSIEDFNKENLPLFIFANWRGFSGGSMDMFYGILKFGSMIVNQLVNYKHPVFVYIPISAELRGGSWVVVDETLNSQIIEMYADVNSKGGILEPPGIVEVKFRYPDIRKLMHSIDTTIIALNEKMARCENDEEKNNIKKDIEIKEKELLPYYLQVCHKYADLHDMSACMKAKGVIRKIVPWNKARSFFYYRLMRRLLINILSRKYDNALIKNEEIENILNDLNNSEDDDYIVCNRVFNNNILRNLKYDTKDIIYNKTLNDFLKIFKMLSQEQRTEFLNKINSYEN
ncbi:hypothetical protein PFMALIP_05541 [Plasmodium falciparum MaliPS096_E11]|uniref:Uncharacterized protein n=1 Tax=Plasmodium falciparum MaliPS096_E11 TaxID=1036727 RepID=A0A024WIC8_PLAFA|nr:hypothetical protein PFMALIP_05541 [Plasmodium falciparum MaliPS096_E11]